MDRSSRWRKAIEPWGLSTEFNGNRWIVSEGENQELTLGHKNPDASSFVSVGVILESRAPSTTVDIYGTLWKRLALGEAESQLEGVEGDSDTARRITREALADPPAIADWRRSLIQLADQRVEFCAISQSSSWIAFRSLGDRWVYVHARPISIGADSIHLVRIRDLTPYLEDTEDSASE
jgi:hypothetical protein